MHVNFALLMEIHRREQRAALVPWTKRGCPAFIKRRDMLPPILPRPQVWFAWLDIFIG
jgi:hypothetical protein